MSARYPRPDWTLRGHAALAGVAVCLAVLAWARPDWLHAPPNTPALAAARGPLTQVRFVSDAAEVRLAPEGDRLQAWRRATGSLADDAPQGCLASAAAEASWRQLGRPRAVRALGKLGAAQLQLAQLAPPVATLTLDFDGATVRLAVGGSPFGRAERFVQNEAGEVFLLPAGALGPLAGGAEPLCAPPDEAPRR